MAYVMTLFVPITAFASAGRLRKKPVMVWYVSFFIGLIVRDGKGVPRSLWCALCQLCVPGMPYCLLNAFRRAYHEQVHVRLLVRGFRSMCEAAARWVCRMLRVLATLQWGEMFGGCGVV